MGAVVLASAPDTIALTGAGNARAPRCRMLEGHRALARCDGLELEDTGLCARHLGQAAAAYRELTGRGPLASLAQLMTMPRENG